MNITDTLKEFLLHAECSEMSNIEIKVKEEKSEAIKRHDRLQIFKSSNRVRNGIKVLWIIVESRGLKSNSMVRALNDKLQGRHLGGGAFVPP